MHISQKKSSRVTAISNRMGYVIHIVSIIGYCNSGKQLSGKIAGTHALQTRPACMERWSRWIFISCGYMPVSLSCVKPQTRASICQSVMRNLSKGYSDVCSKQWSSVSFLISAVVFVLIFHENGIGFWTSIYLYESMFIVIQLSDASSYLRYLLKWNGKSVIKIAFAFNSIS